MESLGEKFLKEECLGGGKNTAQLCAFTAPTNKCKPASHCAYDDHHFDDHITAGAVWLCHSVIWLLGADFVMAVQCWSLTHSAAIS